VPSGGAVLRNSLALETCGLTREAPVFPCKMRGPSMALFASAPQSNAVGRINSLIKIKYNLMRRI
jgi:hypothetical protein